jgi:hypothetical protein
MRLAAGLVPNPHLKLTPEYDGSALVRVTVIAPIRRRPLMVTKVNKSSHPAAFLALEAALAHNATVCPETEQGLTELRKLGIIIDEKDVSRQVTFDIPEIVPSTSDVQAGHYAWKGQTWLDFPARLALQDWVRFTATLKNADSVFWHQASEAAVVNPWRIAGISAAMLREGIPPEIGSILHRAGLARFEDSAELEATADDAIGAGAARFRANGYTTVSLGLPASQIGALRAYYESLVFEGWLIRGDGRSDRFLVHNDAIGRNLQRRVQPVIEAIVGRPLKATYTYAVRYVRGASLPTHKDRPQCKYTATVLLAVDGGDPGISPWPLLIDTGAAQQVAIHQRVGDATMYLGCEMPHSRPPLECESSLSVLLHYVDPSFEGPLD